MSPDVDTQVASARLGRLFAGKWMLERLIGTGGMAAVYAARTPEGTPVAIKVLHAEMSQRAEIRQRFAQEGTTASRVGHPLVVEVLGSGEDADGSAYLVMELLDGEPLGAVLRRDGGVELPRLLTVLDQVLDVLSAAHAKGIVHRDLKPDNLFVMADGRIKVLDFGIARILDQVPGAYRTRPGMTLGTVPYMSPEQALGKRDRVDGRSDLFALGAMTFRLLAGRCVHEAETDAEQLIAMATKPAPPLASVAPQTPAALCAVVDVALAFARESRYPDARTMQEDVRAVARGEQPPYAGRARRAREAATRIDVAAPATRRDRQLASAPTAPEATAPTRPAAELDVTRPLPAPVASSAASIELSTLHPSDIPLSSAPTMANPIYKAVTAPMPATAMPRLVMDGPTLESLPAPPSREHPAPSREATAPRGPRYDLRWRRWLSALALTTAGASGGYFFSQSREASRNAAGSSARAEGVAPTAALPAVAPAAASGTAASSKPSATPKAAPKRPDLHKPAPAKPKPSASTAPVKP